MRRRLQPSSGPEALTSGGALRNNGSRMRRKGRTGEGRQTEKAKGGGTRSPDRARCVEFLNVQLSKDQEYSDGKTFAIVVVDLGARLHIALQFALQIPKSASKSPSPSPC
ncbi:hypothetical protein HPB50_023864 [Hyalomma asiaticum]|uniref:Uncharacterized protein n=1 Tax=Hyalomma asiaticum TaxID=266040 RepID=A0ACB7T4Y7_HYAAI|nr:hypothetical protein HPB50_023864 [Hyalomma asiaticum]